MALLNLNRIHLSYGVPALLEDVTFSVEPGERICLIGRNGEGKSTLMKIISGEIQFDDGERLLQKEARVARLTQEVPGEYSGKVFDLVADGLGDLADLVKSYHLASLQVAQGPDEKALTRLADAQHALEAADGWQLEQRVENVLSRMGLDMDVEFSTLSGGMKRRVLLARALAAGPQLLLLDEPTNHLDMEAISWLEDFLRGWKGTLIFITHDRAFLRALATRILELDRGRIYDWPGDYDNYLRRRAEEDNAEQKANARFDKKLAQEEAWIRQGIKARRTRNEGRVRQLQQMRKEFSQRRSRSGKADFSVNAGEKSGKLVCEAVDVGYSWEGKPLIRDFNISILRGDRIGIIGPNGCGKSTLLNLILGRLAPESGTIKLGTRQEVAYFDQLRSQLKEEESVLDNVADGSDKVTINGKPKHVISYLQDFLFSPARIRQPVKSLSGGERNRLLLAKLFTRPANILVLDEPTNDLDIESLELLEERLLTFDGTLLLVSHDRAFLDNAVTSTLVFEHGRVNHYVGGYSDWAAQREPEAEKAVAGKKQASPKIRKSSPVKAGRKLSYKEKRELETLPAAIEAQEVELEEVQTRLADPGLYKSDPDSVAGLSARLSELEGSLEAAYARWDELEAIESD